MPYVTSIERMAQKKGHQEGLEEGLQKGLRKAIVRVLETRFGRVPKRLILNLDRVTTSSDLEELHSRALTVRSLRDFTASMRRKV